jgi:probable HAF family extracellular repeat protein
MMVMPAVAQQGVAREKSFPLATGGLVIEGAASPAPQTWISPELLVPDLTYAATPLGVLPRRQNSFVPVGSSINDSGMLAGFCWNSFDIFSTAIPFLWQNGTFTPLQLLPNFPGAFAFGLNNQAHAFGTGNRRNNVGNIVQTPVLWAGGAPINLGIPPGYSLAAGQNMNNLDEVVGYAINFQTDALNAFAWVNGQTIQLPLTPGAFDAFAEGVNDQGQIVGYMDFGTQAIHQTRAVTWIPNGGSYTVVQIPGFGGQFSEASKISNDGVIVGDSTDIAGTTYGYVWDGHTLVNIGLLPGGTYSIPTGRNLAGQVYGVADRADGLRVSFLWQDGVMVDVNNLVPGGLPRFASSGGINASGQLASTVTLNDAFGTRRAYLLSPVP